MSKTRFEDTYIQEMEQMLRDQKKQTKVKAQKGNYNDYPRSD